MVALSGFVILGLKPFALGLFVLVESFVVLVHLPPVFKAEKFTYQNLHMVALDVMIAGALLMISGSGCCTGKCPVVKKDIKQEPAKNQQNN